MQQTKFTSKDRMREVLILRRLHREIDAFAERNDPGRLSSDDESHPPHVRACFFADRAAAVVKQAIDRLTEFKR